MEASENGTLPKGLFKWADGLIKKGYIEAMTRLFFLSFILSGCITDDGEIDKVCDEIPEPCFDSNDGEADTGDSELAL